MENEVNILRNKLKEEEQEIITQNEEFKKILETVKKIAEYDVAVLIIGESGTGKELIAKMIHKNSARRNCPFISIDCATLPDTLVESELFGHEKGAFTGANETKIGRFELANTGTLFLDEIGNLSISTQKKLLRVLQEKKITRIGGKKEINLDIRVITATNVDLKESVKKSEFREDLYHRINEFYIELPPLRKRNGDIELLINHFIIKYDKKYDKKVKHVSNDVMNFLTSYSWPGNVRELENVIKHSVIMCESETIEMNDLPKSLIKNKDFASEKVDDLTNFEFKDEEILPIKDIMDKIKGDIERKIIIKALTRYKWNKTKVAEILQIDYKTLYNKIKEYKIE